MKTILKPMSLSAHPFEMRSHRKRNKQKRSRRRQLCLHVEGFHRHHVAHPVPETQMEHLRQRRRRIRLSNLCGYLSRGDETRRLRLVRGSSGALASRKPRQPQKRRRQKQRTNHTPKAEKYRGLFCLMVLPSKKDTKSREPG